MWVDVSERLPERQGDYRVMRRAFGGRPEYEDICHWVMPEIYRPDQPAGYWANRTWVVINTVTKWWEA